MAGLDLSGVRSVIESLLDVSTVRFSRDEQEPVLNDESGQMERPDPAVLYEGQGAILPVAGFNALPDPDTQAVVQRTGATYRALIPIGAAVELRLGDLAQVVDFRVPNEDPQMLERRFEVVEAPIASSLPVIRFVYLKEL